MEQLKVLHTQIRAFSRGHRAQRLKLLREGRWQRGGQSNEDSTSPGLHPDVTEYNNATVVCKRFLVKLIGLPEQTVKCQVKL